MKCILRFLRGEDGSATIEFVLLFPVLFTVLLSTFELGMTMMRQVALDRGLDLAVREIRIGSLDPVTHDGLKALICQRALLPIPNCQDRLRLEMQPVDPRNWNMISTEADCVELRNPARPVQGFVTAGSNQLMVLRACALFDPYFPTSGLGAALKDADGYYALVSTTAFVIEPRRS